MNKVKITVKQWLVKRAENPVPCRTMRGEIVRETAKAVLVRMTGFLEPSTTCLHCGRTLTHPVSLLYGIGPVCGQHFHINPCGSEDELRQRIDHMRHAMESVKYEGWLPKSQIEAMNEVRDSVALHAL